MFKIIQVLRESIIHFNEHRYHSYKNSEIIRSSIVPFEFAARVDSIIQGIALYDKNVDTFNEIDFGIFEQGDSVYFTELSNIDKEEYNKTDKKYEFLSNKVIFKVTENKLKKIDDFLAKYEDDLKEIESMKGKVTTIHDLPVTNIYGDLTKPFWKFYEGKFFIYIMEMDESIMIPLQLIATIEIADLKGEIFTEKILFYNF
jgi:hypothetical protein